MTDPSINILIVDDQIDNLRALSALLSGQGYRVRKALSGKMALETVAAQLPDLILLDISMPEMDGYAVCTQLKVSEDTTHIPILFLSALSHLEDKLRAFEVGGADYITKPFAAEEVLARIQHQVQILQQQRSLHREIQERRQIEARLEQHNQTLKGIFQAVPDEILRLRADATILDDVGQPLKTQTLPWPISVQGQMKTALQQALTEKSVVTVEYTHPRQGECQYYEARITAFRAQEAIVVIRDVTRRRLIELDSARKSGREQLLANITERIHQSLEVSQILSAAVEGTRRLLNVNRVLVYRFNPDWSGEVIIESVNRTDLAIQGVTIHDPCFERNWHHRYLEGRNHVVADIHQDTHLQSCYVEMLSQLQVKSLLVVPIRLQQAEVGHPLWGLFIAHHCDMPHPWDMWEQDLMQQISVQLAVALQRAQLYEVMSRRANREALLNRILDAVRESLDLTTILQRAAAEVRTAFQVDRCTVALLDFTQSDETTPGLGMTATPNGVKEVTHDPFASLDRVYVGVVTRTPRPLVVHNASLPAPRVTAPSPLPSGAPAADVPMASRPALEPSTTEPVENPAILATSLWFEGKAQGVLSVQQNHTPRYWTEDDTLLIKEVADQLAVAVQQARLYQQVQTANATLEKLANLDGLTQVANRRKFDEYLQQTWRWLRRDREPLSLILCDVDYFKRYNDCCGHLAGDDCLKQVAEAIAQVAQRPNDLVARYGGEEFAIILPQTPPAGVLHIAHQIQAAIAAFNLPHPDSPISDRVTVSLGVSSQIPGVTGTPAILLTHADAALYKAKHAGRDRCVTLWCKTVNPDDEQP